VKLGGGEAGSLSGWSKVRQALVWPLKEKDVEKLTAQRGEGEEYHELCLVG
jgi:hypothetical protein